MHLLARISRRLPGALLLAAATLVGSPQRADAAVIEFTAIDQVDIVAGQDLWTYSFLVSDIAFDLDQGFSVYFDSARFAQLANPPGSVGPDWDVLIIQPDPALPDDGLYDALALAPGASLAQPFSVTFIWLGGAGTAPGSQPFSINQYDESGNISFLETGNTVASVSSVPEPSTLLLLSSGLAFTVRRRRSRS
jgi:hypothetical protein